MGMTMTQKILAAHAGLDEVHAGQVVEARVDLVSEKEKGALVSVGALVVGTNSHICAFGGSGAAAFRLDANEAGETARITVPSAIKFVLTGKRNKWVSGKDVILHIIGMIGIDGAIGQSMEFVGDGISELSVEDRYTICDMVMEAGAVNGIFAYGIEADPDAKYERVIRLDLDYIRPLVACPHLPEHTRTTFEVSDISIDQVVIEYGRVEDLRTAAGVLGDHKISDSVRLFISPVSSWAYERAEKEGVLGWFEKTGARVLTLAEKDQLGKEIGSLKKKQRCIATIQNNKRGCLGDTGADVFLASPAVAAASAITGRITDPEEFEW